MTVHCPHCATGYILPDPLVGERGARVRCPACEGSFVVIPENGHGAKHANGGSTPEAPPPLESSAADLAAVASEVLDALADRLGGDLDRARDDGRLFSRHGRELLDAFDEYRRRAPAGEAAPFREALRRRWGLRLGPTQG